MKLLVRHVTSSNGGRKIGSECDLFELQLEMDSSRKAVITHQITTILFDWDGTIVDSAQLGLTAFQKSFAVLGFPFPQHVYEKAYSPNWYTLYEAMGLPADKWNDADNLWLKHYGEQTAAMIEVAGNAILELQRKGYSLGIVSSGSTSRLAKEIENVGLGGVFQVVVCNEQMTRKKPHPEGLHTALHLLDCAAACACYVGDSPEDITMGKSAGVMTVGVRSSYPTSWRVAEAEPDISIDSLADIAEHF
ncbi:MAG TPA: HAD family hydrolase [Pyrinomonadaceae bacterium]|nr:HAD family hydrolase [Pyrinomonadaceae bacterium]